jgi:hypothetical protein
MKNRYSKLKILKLFMRTIAPQRTVAMPTNGTNLGITIVSPLKIQKKVRSPSPRKT